MVAWVNPDEKMRKLLFNMWIQLAMLDGATYSEIALQVALAGGKIASPRPSPDSRTTRVLIKVEDAKHGRRILSELNKISDIKVKSVAVIPAMGL